MGTLTRKQQQLLNAIVAGASVRRGGWQQLHVTFGPRDERNYVAMESTLLALRDRGLVRLTGDGIERMEGE